MTKPLSSDLRERLIEAVVAGMSRRAAADRFGIAASTAVKWVRRWRDTGSKAPRPQGGDKRSDRIEAHEGERLRLKFVRKDYSSCTREVVFPTLNIRRELPTNQAVIIELPALVRGEIEFRCGMNMVRGTIVVH